MLNMTCAQNLLLWLVGEENILCRRFPIFRIGEGDLNCGEARVRTSRFAAPRSVSNVPLGKCSRAPNFLFIEILLINLITKALMLQKDDIYQKTRSVIEKTSKSNSEVPFQKLTVF